MLLLAVSHCCSPRVVYARRQFVGGAGRVFYNPGNPLTQTILLCYTPQESFFCYGARTSASLAASKTLEQALHRGGRGLRPESLAPLQRTGDAVKLCELYAIAA